MAKRYDDEVRVERDAGMPAAFVWRDRRYEVADVIGRASCRERVLTDV